MSQDRRGIPGLLALPALVVVGLLLAVSVGSLVLWALAPGGAATLFLPPFPEALLRTVRVSLLATLLVALLAFPAALCLVRSGPRTRRALTLLVVAALLASAAARAHGWRLLLGAGGLLGTEAAVVIGLAECFLPFLILILLRRLDRLDPDLIEAARGLGASSGQALLRVDLPFALPGLLLGGGFVLAGSLSALAAPAFLGGNTVATGIADRAPVASAWPGAAAASLALLALGAAALAGGALLARRADP